MSKEQKEKLEYAIRFDNVDTVKLLLDATPALLDAVIDDWVCNIIR